MIDDVASLVLLAIITAMTSDEDKARAELGGSMAAAEQGPTWGPSGGAWDVRPARPRRPVGPSPAHGRIASRIVILPSQVVFPVMTSLGFIGASAVSRLGSKKGGGARLSSSFQVHESAVVFHVHEKQF